MIDDNDTEDMFSIEDVRQAVRLGLITYDKPTCTIEELREAVRIQKELETDVSGEYITDGF